MSAPAKLTRENYFDFDALSNSTINWALPQAGGSIDNYHYMKRASAAKELSEEENSSMRKGTALHRYIESPSTFEMISCPMPGPGMLKVVKALLAAPHILSLTDPANKSEIVRIARESGYGGSWGEDTILKKVLEEGISYFQATISAALSAHKMLVSPAEQTIIEACIDRIKYMPWLVDPDEFYGSHWNIMKEVPIEFVYEGVKCKALIDRLIVNHDSKEFCVEDLKTTSTPIEQYLGYETKDWNPVTKNVFTSVVPGKYLERGVHRQLAFYTLAVISSGMFPGYTLNTASILALQTIAPFSFKRFNVEKGYLDVAAEIMSEIVKTIAKHGEDTVEL